MAHEWTSQETGYLKRYAATKTLNDLVQRFDAEPAEVRGKLRELQLTTKDGEPADSRFTPDPMVEPFEKGMKALYDKKWSQAIKHFEKVVAESEQPELTARAEQLLAAARLRDGEAPDEATPYLRAVWAKNNGDFDETMKIVKAQKKDEEGRFAYLAATIHAVEERPDEAAETLQKAIDADSRNMVQAYHDPDFAEMRQDKDHAHLFGMD